MATDPTPSTIMRVVAAASPGSRASRWHVEPDPYPARTPTTERLQRIVVETADGAEVRVFAKTIRSLRHWPAIAMVPPPGREALIARFPWRVEADAYASGLLDRLPPGLRTPMIFEIEDLGDDRIRIWMDDVAPAPAAWDLTRYRRAARALGRLAGCWLGGSLPPGTPALFPGPRFIFEGRTAVFDVPAIRDHSTWTHPLLVGPTTRDPRLRQDLLDLAEAAPAILGALDRLPRTLAHGDACPQNLLTDPSRTHGFVAIDWGFVGLAPVGLDLGQLLVGRAESGDLTVGELPAIRDAIVDGYVTGLGDEGATVSREEVLAGFTGGLLLRSGFTALPLELLDGSADQAARERVDRRALYVRFLLDQRAVVGL